MRPLSTINFFLKNRKKIFSNVLIIVVTICLVYVMECFIASIVQSIYPLDATRFEYASIIVATDIEPDIPQEVISSLNKSKNVQSIIPVTIRQIVFSVPGSTTHTAVFSTSTDYIEKLVEGFKIRLASGQMPSAGMNEIAVDISVAKNNGLQVGSQTVLDASHNLYRTYTVVGLLESDSHISLVGSPSPEDSGLKPDEKGLLVFPSAGFFEQAENEVLTLIRQGLKVWTLSRYKKLFAANTQTFQILDTMVVLSIIVMVVCLVCSKYAYFFSRKSEYGILSALGYSRSEIIRRSFREVILTNLIGFIIGVVLAVFICKIIVSAAFCSKGGIGVYLLWKAVGLSLLAPMLTTVFTLIPVQRMINRVDPISMIQSN